MQLLESGSALESNRDLGSVPIAGIATVPQGVDDATCSWDVRESPA